MSDRPDSIRTHEIAALALGALPIVALGLADGGFYPRPWGWAAFVLASAIVVAAVGRRDMVVSRHAVLLVVLLSSLGAWIAASLAWTQSTSLTALELERLLVYLAALGAAALLVRPGSGRGLLVGVLVGTSTVSLYGLAAYLLTRERDTDLLQGSFLHRPIGYANGMAIVTVMAILLAVGFASTANARVHRAGLGMLLVPLASALALTGSRASMGALVVGGGVTLAVAGNRRRWVLTSAALLVVPVTAFVFVSSTELTNSSIVGAAADRLGERTFVVILALTVLSVAPALLPDMTSRSRLHVGGVVRIALAAGALLVLAAVVTRGPDLAGDRLTFWDVALDEFAEHPFSGSGAGTFAQVWLERRPSNVSVRDAHSLPVETMSELGVVGLAFVVALLVVPLVWAVRRRDHHLMPTAAGAYSAFALHACVDWDWELPAVTLAGLLCAVSIGSLADRGAQAISLRPAFRALPALAGSVGAMIAMAVFLGASAMEDANRALARGDVVAAERAARRAERWQPWAGEPVLVQGRAELAAGERLSAQMHFVRAASREPADYRAWLALAAVTDGEVAGAAVDRARALNPRSVSDLSGS